MLSIIVAHAQNMAIGKDNQLLWRLSSDLKNFKQLTMGHKIIMGRKTFESIGKALPGRTNIVISRTPELKIKDCIVAKSLESALKSVSDDEEAFIIGGAQIYRQSMDLVDKMYITKVQHSFDADTFFPEYNMDRWQELERANYQKDEKNHYDFSIIVLKRK